MSVRCCAALFAAAVVVAAPALHSHLRSSGFALLGMELVQLRTERPRTGSSGDKAMMYERVVRGRRPRLPVQWGWTHANLTAVAEFEAWDLKHGPSSDHRRERSLASWPPLTANPSGWALPGIVDPRVVVVSMPGKMVRRQRFRDMYRKILDLNVSAQWSPAVVGKLVPDHLRWLRGQVDGSSWDHDKPGNFGCFLSHLAILRESQTEFPGSDVVVFEDDAIFIPDFRERFAGFVESLPPDWDMLRLGGQSLWNVPLAYTPNHTRVYSYANTWGYVVRAGTVERLADLLAALPVRGSWGIDAIFQLFAREVTQYAPTVPLVYTNSACHDTGSAELRTEDCETRSETVSAMYRSWPMGYIRTYCKRRGEVREGGDSPLCKEPESEGCCPYLDPPVANANIPSQ